jgi:hypothetical protein
MSGPTTSRPPGRPSLGVRPRWRAWYLLPLVALIPALLPLSSLLDGPPVVDRITIENPTDYDITVDVSNREGRYWMSAGTLRRRSTEDLEQIIDQGEAWILRFRAQGEEGGQLRLTRDELRAARWRIRVPDSVIEELQAKGALVPP